MAAEVEIQLIARGDLDGAAVFDAAARWQPTPPVVRRLEARYHPAPDLTAARYVLRARREDEAIVAALKGPGPVVSGVPTRLEIERGLSRFPEADEALPAAFVEALQAAGMGRTTWPAFGYGNRVRRLQADLALPGGAELVVDVGVLQAGERQLPIAEVEVESTGATAQQIGEVARALAQALDLRPSGLSKGARGLALRGELGEPRPGWLGLLEVEERLRLGEARSDRVTRWASVVGGAAPPLDSDEHAAAVRRRWEDELRG